MVDVVVRLMVSLLEADHAVHAVVGELAVVLGAQRLHLNLYVAEVALGDADSLAEVGRAGLCGVLARDDEDILKRSQTLDGPELVLYLCRGEDHSTHGILAVEGAVDAAVGAGVGDVEGYKHRHGAPEALLGVMFGELGHLLNVRLGRGRDEGHEVLNVAAALAEGAAHVGLCFGGNALSGFLPAYLF